MKKILRIVLMFTALCLAFSMSAGAVSYTYNVDEKAVEMPDAAVVEKSIFSEPSGEFTLVAPSDIAADSDGNLYVCDSGAGKILVFDSELKFKNEIANFTLPDGQATVLKAPQGISIDKNNNICIADSESGRVLVGDLQGNISRVITVTDKQLYLKNFTFKPIKVASDSWGNVYVLASGVYDGLLQFDVENDFIGFVGSNEVDASFIDIMWKKFATKKQREQYAKTLPVEFTSIDVDSEDFVYTVTASISNDPESSENVRKQTAKGNNILKTSELFGKVMGDLDFPFSWEGGLAGSSSFIDIAAGQKYGFSALDSNHGRVFVYNEDSDLLFAFGGKGMVEGSFQKPSAITSFGNRIFVLDSATKSVTVFQFTDYGRAILDAQQSYIDGKYEQSVDEWKAVLKQNSNLRIGYSGIARSYIMLGEYSKGMHYAKMADDQTTYSKAFKYYRKDMLRDNFFYILVGIAVAVGAIAGLVLLCKRFAVNKKLSKYHVYTGLTYSRYIATHPFKGFYDMSHEHHGDIVSSAIIYVVYAFSVILKSRYSSFLFTKVGEEFNLITSICTAVVPVALWCICNWAVSTLMEGDGTPKQIVMATSYALVPFTLANILCIPLTYFLTEEESMFMTVLMLFGIIWSGFLLLTAVITVHDFTLMRAIGTIIITLIGIAIVIFLFLLVFNLVQQMAYFVISIYNQLIIRL